MLVINKKRISIILSAILIGVFTYSYQFTKINRENNALETTTTPASGKVIVVDARTWKTR